MKPIDIIAHDLFNKVRSRFTNLQMGDESGTVTVDPNQARFFDFDFSVNNEVIGRISISINEVGSLKIYYSKGITEQQDQTIAKHWYDFLKEMRFFAKRRLLRFDTRDITKGNLDKTDFKYLAQKTSKDEDTMNEAAMFGSSKTSHRKLENTDLIIRHSEAIDPNKAGARSRKIKNLFIQNKEGERFKFPFIYLPGARAMQRHIANGGYPHDDIGKHIIETCEEILKLSDFGKKIRTSTLNDNAHHISEKAILKLQELRQHMEALGKQRYYASFKDSYTPIPADSDLPMDAKSSETLRDAFPAEQFDESMYGILRSLMTESSELDLVTYVAEGIEVPPHRTSTCASNDVAEEFSHWVESVVSEGLTDTQLQSLQQIIQEPLYVGANDEAVQALLGIGIDDPGLIKAIRGVENMPNGAKTDARDIIRSYLGDDADKLNWGDAQPASQMTGQPMGENVSFDKEEFDEWKADALQRLASGEIKDWTDLYGELVGELGIPGDKAEKIARRMVGIKDKPIDVGHEVPADYDEPRDYERTFRSNREVAECAVEKPSDHKEIWKAVEGFLDKENGTWTKGRPGIVAHISRELGEEAGEKAKVAISVLSKKYPMRAEKEDDTDSHEFDRIRHLAGIHESEKPSAGLTKNEKSSIVKKAKAGKDIGKAGKGFAEIEKSAKKSGAKDPKAVAAATMWKNIKR